MRTWDRIVASIGISAIAVFWTLASLAKAEPTQSPPAANAAQPIDKAAWAGKLAALKDADWREASRVGDELAELPADEGYEILKENWEKIETIEARQQILKSWKLAMPYPLHARNHPHLVDVLDLGMRDRSPEVQKWALNSLRGVAFQDFAEDFAAYKKWNAAARGKPVVEIICESVGRFVGDLAKAEGKEAEQLAELVKHEMTFRDVPESRRAAMDTGILKIIERWIASSIAPKADRISTKLASHGLEMLTQLQVGEEDVRRIAVPLLAKNVPSDVRTAAVGAIGRKEFPWAVDLVIDALKMTAGESGRTVRPDLWGIAGTLAGLDDPKAIPVMIAVIDDDNTYNTVYGVGYFGLGRLTGVKYDDAHDGAWWRKWWENNREKYPAPVRDMAIPELSSRASALASHDNRAGNSADDADALADVKDVPAQDLRIGGDGKKRYFLIGKVEQVDSPADPTGLVVVLPGGDGSADFHPFIRRISKNVLPTGWLIAQAVAPQWDKKQPELVVWPTEKLPYPGAKFTTEEFIEGIIADVRAKAKVDSRRIFLLGWSSGGPPCYAAALRKETPVTGAFIAMSVFKPQLMPAIDHAKDRAFYLLQSPDDQVTPIRFAVDAEKALDAAGAKVRLRRYDGGHGWQGDVWKMIGEGIQWLEKPVADGTVTSLSPLSDPGLEVADVGTPTEKSGWMFMATPGEAGYRIASETDQVIAGKRCARLEQEGKFEGIGFGNLMQVIDAAPYRGKRVRFRAAVRSQVEGAGNQAMLWMRVDRTGQNGKEESGFFDNMHERPIKAKEWQHYDIVGDVADDARLVNLGMVLVGSGKAWLDDASLEVVGADVPLTGPEQVKQKAKEALADKSSSNILLNPSFEDGDKSPAEWSQGADIDGVEYSWDKNAGQKGKASLCLNKTAKRYFPIAQWSQIVERKTDRPSLQVSAQVKAEGVTKATIDVIFLDENGKSISHEWAAYIGAKEAKDPPADHDWKEYVSKVKIPKRTRKLQICLQISGPGKVWFDEIRAEYVE